MPTGQELYAGAVAQARAGRFDRAAALLETLVGDEPAHAQAWAMLGSMQLGLERAQDAVASCDRALALRPLAATLVNRGVALVQLGRAADALESFDRAIALEPGLAVAHSNRAQVLNGLERHDEALASADRALVLQPAFHNARSHRATALHGLERYAEALADFQAVRRAMPGSYDALCNVGMTLAALGRYGDAMSAYDAAVAIDPGAALARYRRAHVRLLLGDFAGGWPDYEARWRAELFTARGSGYVTPDWRARLTVNPTAEDLAGRRVLVLAEQGVGDQIMFASVLPDLATVAASVTCVCDPRLGRLFRHSFPSVDIPPPETGLVLDPRAFDRVLALGSLAAAFRGAAADFPGRAYLAPGDPVVAAWRARLGPKPTRLRIGVSWRGGLRRTGASARSMELETLRPLLERPDCEFVNLQYGDVTAELAAFNTSLARPITSFAATEIDAFDELAGLVQNLDLVVTVQTALAHLVGALGQTGLVMIPPRPEWRYGVIGPDIPWYRSLRLFRQADTAGWAPVLARIGAALDAA